MHSLQSPKIHRYTDIEERNRGLASNPQDFHIWRHEDTIWGDTDWTYHLGDKFLLSVSKSGQFARARFDWNPNPFFSKDEIVKRLIENYSQGVLDIIKGSPQITAEIQLQYKTKGKDVKFKASEAQSNLPSIYSHQDYPNFRGFVLWGFDPPGYFTCAGLDSVKESPWNTSEGYVFVETDMPLGDWFSKLFYATSKPIPCLEQGGLTNLLEAGNEHF